MSFCLLHALNCLCYTAFVCAPGEVGGLNSLNDLDRGVPMLSRAGHYLLFIVTMVFFYWVIGLCMPFTSIHVTGEGEMAAKNSLRKQLHDWPRLHFLTRTDRIVSVLQQNPWVDKVSAFKSFDGSLRIRMSYKQPVMRSIGGRYLMDSRGQSLMTHVTDDLLRLPVFDGQQTVMRQAHQLWLRLDLWQPRLMVMTHHPFLAGSCCLTIRSRCVLVLRSLRSD